jgi:hypothetical protein
MPMQWPRLLASRIERRTVKGLYEPGLEALMLEAIRSDDRILGMAVAFEPVSRSCYAPPLQLPAPYRP